MAFEKTLRGEAAKTKKQCNTNAALSIINNAVVL